MESDLEGGFFPVVCFYQIYCGRFLIKNTGINAADPDHVKVFLNEVIHTVQGAACRSSENVKSAVLLADSKAVVGNANLATLQTDVDRLSSELALAQAELAVLKDKVVNLTAENDLLRLKLEHKEEIISIHNYYNKLNQNN